MCPPGSPAGSQRGDKPRRLGEGRTVGATPAQGLWGNAQSRLAAPRGAGSKGRRDAGGGPGQATRYGSLRPPLGPASSFPGSRALSATLAAGFRWRWASRAVAQSSPCFWLPLVTSPALSLPGAPGLCCADFGDPLWLLFFSKQIFTKSCPRETALGHQCLRNCIRYKMLLNGSEIRRVHGHYIRASVHGEDLGPGATPDPMRSLSRGTWTVADRSPAPGVLKTPPGNCPCQMGRVRCRLIKGLARGQPCGRERSKVMSHSQPRTRRAEEGPPLSHPIL